MLKYSQAQSHTLSLIYIFGICSLRLRKRFKYVFFVFGNQELWAGNYAGDSIDKFFEILDLCDATGIITAPAFLGDSLAVVPLFSWYNICPSLHGNGHMQGLHGGFTSTSSARYGGWGSSFPGGSYSRARAATSGTTASAAAIHDGSSSHSRPRVVAGHHSEESWNKEPFSGRNARTNSSSSSSSSSANGGSQARGNNNNDAQCRWPQAVAEAAVGLHQTSGGGGAGGDWSSRPTGSSHHHYRSFSPDSNSGGTSSSPQSGSVGCEQVNTYYSGSSAFAAAGASAFFHELNREALGVDYGRRRVLSFSHFVPHDRLLTSSETSSSGPAFEQQKAQAATGVGAKAAVSSQFSGATSSVNQGSGAASSSSSSGNNDRVVSPQSSMPTPLTEELERLNATAHAFGQANGSAVSRVEALEGVCFMQHTLGDYDPTFQSSRFSTGQPQYRDRTATKTTMSSGGKVAATAPKSATKSGRGKHGSAGKKGSAAAASARKKAHASPANTKGGSAQTAKSATKSPDTRSGGGGGAPAGEEEVAALVAEASSSTKGSDNHHIDNDNDGDVGSTPAKVGVPECDRERPVVVAASRRLQLAWDDHYYAELTLTVAHAHADALRRGVPVVKHGRNKVAASRMLFVSVTRHCADGSAAPEEAPLPASSSPTRKGSASVTSRQFGTGSSGDTGHGEYEAWRLENNGGSGVDNGHQRSKFSGGRGGGVQVKGRSGSPVPSDAGSDSPRAALGAGINSRGSTNSGGGISESIQAGGFTKVWVELGHRGAISALDRRKGGRAANKRFDLAHLRGVCVGRQTDTFQQSSRQPPLAPVPTSNAGSHGSTGSSLGGPSSAAAANAAAAAARAIFEPPPGSSDLCLSLIGGEGWGHRSLDLEFKTMAARDAALRFFRHEMRKLECRSGAGLLPPPAAAAAAAARAARAASVIGRRRSTLI